MITWRGAVYLVILFLNAIAIAYTDYVILSGLFLLMLILPFLSAGQLIWSCRQLEVRQDLEPNPVSRTEQANLKLLLRQRGWQAQGKISYTLKMSGRQGKSLFMHRQAALMPGQELAKSYQVQCPHRGQFRIGLSRMLVRDMFGLFFLPVRLRRTWRRQMQSLTVWPLPLDLQAFQRLASLLKIQPDQLSPRFGDEVDAVANIRNYFPGDAMKRIHWKITARLREVMIKEFEKPLQQEILLLLDPAPVPLTEISRLSYLDFYSDCAAGIAQMGLAAGSQVHSVWYDSQGRQQAEARKPDELSEILWQLAELDFADYWTLEQILDEERRLNPMHWTLCLLSSRLTANMVDILTDLQERQYTVCLVLIPGGRDQPPDHHLVGQLEASQIPVLILEVSLTDAVDLDQPAVGESKEVQDRVQA